MDFHVAVDINDVGVLIAQSKVIAQLASIGDHDFGGGPLVDVVELEAQRSGLELHDGHEEKGREQGEKKGGQRRSDDVVEIEEENGQHLGRDEGVLHEFDLLADLVLQEDEDNEQPKRGEVENGELRASIKEITIDFVDNRIDSHNSTADSRSPYPCLDLFPADKLKIEVKLPNQEGHERKEGDNSEDDEENAEFLKAGPKDGIWPKAIEQTLIIFRIT